MDVTHGRARGGEQALELQRGDHVRVASVAKFFGEFSVINLVTGRQDDRPDIERLLASGHVMVNGIYPTRKCT